MIASIGLYSPTYAKHNTTLSSSSSPRQRESSQGMHTLAILIMVKLMLFYEQDIGSESSITVDMAFRKI